MIGVGGKTTNTFQLNRASDKCAHILKAGFAKGFDREPFRRNAQFPLRDPNGMVQIKPVNEVCDFFDVHNKTAGSQPGGGQGVISLGDDLSFQTNGSLNICQVFSPRSPATALNDCNTRNSRPSGIFRIR
jgi:hypothetical protein